MYEYLVTPPDLTQASTVTLVGSRPEKFGTCTEPAVPLKVKACPTSPAPETRPSWPVPGWSPRASSAFPSPLKKATSPAGAAIGVAGAGVGGTGLAPWG